MRRAVSVVLAGGVLVWSAVARSRASEAAARTAAAARPEAQVRALDIEFFERRVAEDPLGAADRSRLAALYLQRARETGSDHDYARAEAIARRSLALRSAHNAETHALLTAALLARHDFAGALRSARELYAADTTNARHVAQLGEVELELGDYAGAARHFERVARRVDDLSVAARVARWYELTGRAEKARALLRRSLERLDGLRDVPREQVAWFHYRLGELELRRGRLRAADSSFERALRVFPSDYRALGGMARSAAARGEWRTAIELGSRAIAVRLDPGTLGTMSDAYAALGDTAQARSFADAMAVSALSQPGSIHRAWGLFLLDHGREVERVLREARRSVATRRDVYGYDLLAWALYKAGRPGEARRAAEASLAQGTEDAQLWYHAGTIAAACGDSAGARRLLARARALDPRFDSTPGQALARGANAGV